MSSAEVTDENLALHKPAWQSTTMMNGKAANAVDGNTKRPCTCTISSMLDPPPWWAVDLGHVYRVTYVTITNIGTC